MSIAAIIGSVIGFAIGLLFGLFKLTIMLGCELSKIAASAAVNEIKKAAEVQPAFKVKEAQ